ncbi:MAG: hypothetical protein ISS82_01290 [Nanoarchaeota archaeon]|nr:hypothetical protein [Nanoarchaeota archaeon]
MQYKILTKKETKQLINKIKQQYSIKNLELDYIFLKNKERILVVSDKFSKVELDNLNINAIGMYFANVTNKIRLTIEGSQIIGHLANNNVLEINEEQLKDYFAGTDLNTDKTCKDFVILKYKDMFLGTGKYKEGKIINFFPKERRVKFK